jgi:hypothetical protein
MKKMGLRLTKLFALATLLLSVTASSGAAAGRAHPHLLGVVPHNGKSHALAKPSAAAGPAFFTFDAPYVSLIDRYFGDVAHDSGGTTNVYSVATQYSDNTGPIAYQSTFAGSYVDRDPLPANGCSDGVDPVCLTDFQLQAEIQNVLTAKGWHGTPTNEFFLMTPVGVGSCGDPGGTECSTNAFCAYHNAFTDAAGEPVIYANEPYEGQLGGCSDPAKQGFPNDPDADTTINTISHEHNESITDPFGDAWIDVGSGDENGDLCAYTYGAPLGTVGGQPYNQVINGHDYSLQQEFSDLGSACIQNATQEHPPMSMSLPYNGGLVMRTNTTYAIYWLPTPGNTTPPSVSGAAAANQTLSSTTGSWNGAPTSYSYQWQRCLPNRTACVNIPGATASTYTATSADVGNILLSTVSATNVNGASPYAVSDPVVVASIPAASAGPVISGVPAVGKTLSTTDGAWNTGYTAPTVGYQWLRCAADGTGCAAISGATGSTYTLTHSDAGHTPKAEHTLRVAVTETNAAGTGSATSAASALIQSVPYLIRAPQIAGNARVGSWLRARRGPGAWYAVKATFKYTWLRCTAHGSGCVPIKKATRSSYHVTRRDAGHRLRLRVTATNAAGHRKVASRATARVPAPH